MRFGLPLLMCALLIAAGCGNAAPEPEKKGGQKSEDKKNTILVGKDKMIKLLAKQLRVAESKITLDKTIMGDLGADELDFVELIMAVQASFHAEITDGAIERKLGKKAEDALKTMTVGQLLELANAHRKRASRNKFLADRIGADRRDGIPVELIFALDNREYRIRIIGKNNSVGALITQKKNAYTVHISAKSMDLLAKLKSAMAPEGVVIKVRHTRDSGFVTHKLDNKHEVVQFLRRIIAVFNLPEYRVQDSDTFSDILEKRLNNEFTLEEVLSVNPGLNIEHLQTGQRIKLPAKAGTQTP